MFISKKHLSRRTMLRSLGTAVALPLLDAMVPAGTALAQTAANPKTRFGGIYIPHGATLDMWTPTTTGKNFEFSPILKPLEKFRSSINIISNTVHNQVGPWEGEDFGGAENHNRAAAVFLTGAHPVKGDLAVVGESIDQVAAQYMGQDTPLPSIELSIEPAGLNCGNNFTCAYRNTLSWKTPTLPLPMENNPQLVFENLFGDGTTDGQRRERRNQASSLLDSLGSEVNSLQRNLTAADKSILSDYLDEVREIERRVHLVDEKLSSDIELPDAPVGIPRGFENHLNLMFDLQLLAFKTEITRISTLMLARENSNTSFPGSGVREGFHNASHHSNERANKDQYARINNYHVSLLAGFLEKMANTPDGDGNLLENSMILYGSSLSDGNEHNYDPLPIVVAGNAGGALEGGRHLMFGDQTPMANLLLAMLHKMDVPVESIGDSTEPLAL